LKKAFLVCQTVLAAKVVEGEVIQEQNESLETKARQAKDEVHFLEGELERVKVSCGAAFQSFRLHFQISR